MRASVVVVGRCTAVVKATEVRVTASGDKDLLVAPVAVEAGCLVGREAVPAVARVVRERMEAMVEWAERAAWVVTAAAEEVMVEVDAAAW
mmetsp:Transcript_18756/g.50858  ORF Transcript_18756/g.50858 Transcript_18756/m.50858 type:complete len:90 (+) Transcript_18756:974-1243(+)